MQLPLSNLEDLDRSKITVDLVSVDKNVFKTVETIFVYLRNIGAKEPSFNFTGARLEDRWALLLGYLQSKIPMYIPCLVEEAQNILSYAIDGELLTEFKMFSKQEVEDMFGKLGESVLDRITFLRSVIAYMTKVAGIGVDNDTLSEEHGQKSSLWFSKNTLILLSSDELVRKLAQAPIPPMIYTEMFNEDTIRFIRANGLLDNFINALFAAKVDMLQSMVEPPIEDFGEYEVAPEL